MTDPVVCAFIPARAGSKGIPRKNLAFAGGMSLLQRAILFAQTHHAIDRVVVSTDGDDIAHHARLAGAAVHPRPPNLAGDETRVIEALRHFLSNDPDSCDILVLLEPTSPLRDRVDVDACLAALRAGADSAATFTPASLHPHRAFVISDDGVPTTFIEGAVPWAPRQQLRPPAFELTGGAYAFWVERLPPDGDSVIFGNIHAVQIPPDRALDIDTLHDLRVADAILS